MVESKFRDTCFYSNVHKYLCTIFVTICTFARLYRLPSNNEVCICHNSFIRLLFCKEQEEFLDATFGLSLYSCHLKYDHNFGRKSFIRRIASSYTVEWKIIKRNCTTSKIRYITTNVKYKSFRRTFVLRSATAKYMYTISSSK